MKKLMIWTILAMLSTTLVLTYTPQTAHANDIDVYNVSLQNYKASASPVSVDIKFDLTWKNSYTGTDANNASYWDRAWVFVKYIKSTNLGGTNNIAWKHATLYKAGTAGTNTGAYSSTNGVGVSTDQKGVFCKPGMNQIIRWNIGTDEAGVASTDTYKVRVFAIEMVLVPTGPFYIGDGNGTLESGGAFHLTTGGTATDSYVTTPISTTAVPGVTVDVNNYDDDLIEGSTGIAIGSATGNGIDDTVAGGSVSNPNFPTGYKGFYIMKYELSQGDYVSFLNTLSREQQQTRIATSITSTTTSVTNVYVMYNTSGVSYRNTIVCPSTLTVSVPITFSTATPCRACNWICWADLCAYADWSGLRPMTELEFEKACRGGATTPTYGEYAWGTTGITMAASITTGTDGTPNEKVNQIGDSTHGLCCLNGAIQGPLRSGFAATATSGTTNRVPSGASYYGVMDLSGNNYERCVTVGNPTGRLFDGAQGDGTLATDGNAYGTTLQYWPGYVSGLQEVNMASAVGCVCRGAYWNAGSSLARASDRINSAGADNYRNGNYGIRCARTEGS
jgi:formylglycine-generating enzyme required for sulfatase activity